MRRILVLTVFILSIGIGAHSRTLDYVHVRVVDVGAALCCIVSLPNDEYMVYDMGYNKYELNDEYAVTAAKEQIKTLIPPNDDGTPVPIKLLVISHQHEDHFSGISDVFGGEDNPYQIENILFSRYFEPDENDPESGMGVNELKWETEINSLSYRLDENNVSQITEISPAVYNDQVVLANSEGQVFQTDDGAVFTHGSDLGFFSDPNVHLTFVAGWSEKKWGKSNPNGTSIVLRLEYNNTSVLFTGDTIGQKWENQASQIKDAEDYMVTNDSNGTCSINSDVMFAPHHGSNGSSSTLFIQTISPTYVIFPAGTKHKHPTQYAYDRYIEVMKLYGCDTRNFFRTDYGDDEPGDKEWTFGLVTGHRDKPGDDNVDIWMFSDGHLAVNYFLTPHTL